MNAAKIVIASEVRCELAENPRWDGERNCLYWTDIPAGRIYSLDYGNGNSREIYRGVPVGGFTLQANGQLLLFRVNDIAELKPDGTVTSLRTFTDPGMERFNDVIADPEGRVFAGTIGKKPDCGLYRFDRDGTITKLFSGTGCSNGMGFSPDLKTFYWTCTTTRRIYQFEYDRPSGTIANRRIFYEATPEEGLPDGLTVDSEGNVWSARWAGSAVVRHGKDGKVLDSIRFPVGNITSVCFGGPGLQDLFVTSAPSEAEHHQAGGSLFKLRLGIAGRPEFKSRIRVEGC